MATLVLSAAAFGGPSPAQAAQADRAMNGATEAPATTASVGLFGKAQPVAVTKATLEEIQATAASGKGKLFTLNPEAGIAAIHCFLHISPPFGGGSPGASVQVDAAVQCTDWVDFISLYVELWRDLGQAANSGAALVGIPALYVSAREGTCRNGIYWGVATGFVRRSGIVFTPSPWAHTHSVPIPIGCGSAPPPPPPPPAGAVTVINPGEVASFVRNPVALQMRATGGTGSYTWSANGLPPGLYINPSTGLITGQVNSLGTATVTVTAVSGIGSSGFTTFTWRIVRELCPTC